MALSLLPGVLLILTRYYSLRPLLGAFISLALGFSAAQWRTVSLNTPMLKSSLPPTLIEGCIERVEYLPKGMRLTLSHLAFFKTYLKKPPLLNKVRLTLRGRLQPSRNLEPGQVIRLRAVLMPPRGPSMPGAYNFRQRAYFEGLGAVGYALSSPQVLSPGSYSWKESIAFSVERRRQRVTQRLQNHISGQGGAIAAALITGDRAGLQPTIRQHFVDAGLAHILAISGLHLSIIAGLVFAFIRGGLSLIPAIALNYPIKKWSAMAACLITAGYLLLSGGAIPALRAFLMTSLVMLAILFDRQSFSMRSVALAASFILMILPEAILGPSFQLSFAAVIALIAVYEGGGPAWVQRAGKSSLLRSLLHTLWGILLTTTIATLATAPLTAYNFNRLTLQGIAANILAIPLTSLFIMPAAIVTLFLMLFGQESYGCVLLGLGTRILASIAQIIAAWPGAVLLLPDCGPLSLLFLSAGGLWLCLWRQAWRWWGIGLVVLGLCISYFHVLPDVYLSPQGKLIGVRDSEGQLWVSSLQACRYARDTWLQQSGISKAFDFKSKKPHAHPQILCAQNHCHFIKNGSTLTMHFSGRNSMREICTQKGTVVFDADDLEDSSGCIIYMCTDHPIVYCVAESIGQRPWR